MSAEPTPTELIRELRERLGLSNYARPDSPKQVWEETLAEIDALRSRRQSDDLPLLINATVTELAVLLAKLATVTGQSEIAVQVAQELDRMAERADLELRYQ